MTTILYIIVVVMAALIIIGAVIIKNLLSQNDTLKESIEIYSNKIESVEDEAIKYHKYFLELFTKTYQELQRIDKKGSFSSDDEVGFAFRVLLAAIETVKNKIGAVEIEDPENNRK